MSDDDIDDVIAERGTVHGDYENQALATESIKLSIRAGLDMMEKQLPAVAMHSLDQIATKIGRIIAGDETFHDHWTDIEGYARLAKRAMSGTHRYHEGSDDDLPAEGETSH